MLDDWLVFILNSLGDSGAVGTDSLLLMPAEYNAPLHDATVTIHNTAVKPITSIILSIMFVLMLATTSTRAEGDRELGVRIIAATMFKIALVFIVAQNAVLILDAISSVAATIAGTANTVDVGAGGGDPALGDQLRDDIAAQGLTEKVTLLVILLLPWLVSVIASVLVIVLVYIRFLQMYLMSAFASLPLAFLGHEDTKSIGIGYLKGFATVALTGTVIVITVKFYQALTGGFASFLQDYNGEDFVGFLFNSFGNFFIAPIVLIFLLLGANGLAKKIVGEG